MAAAPVLINGSVQYSTEEMFTGAQQQINNPHEQHAIDPSLQKQKTQQNTPIAREMSIGPVQTSVSDVPIQPMSHLQSFYDKENESFVSVNDGSQDESGAGNLKKKKGSASSIANDQELKRLYQENKTRTLRDVADSVLQEERGPRSEKTKQIFAMIW